MLAFSWCLRTDEVEQKQQGIGKDSLKPSRACRSCDIYRRSRYIGKGELARRYRDRHDQYACTNEVGIGQIVGVSLAVNARDEAIIVIGDQVHVIQYRKVLVCRSLKAVRESASGAVRRPFGADVCSAANASNIGTCKSWWPGERLVLV